MIKRIFRFIKRLYRTTFFPLQVSKQPISIESWLKYYQSKTIVNTSLPKENERYPFVSVIVVTYNNLTYSKLCLESVYKNTFYPNFEIIVIDNASTDETPIWLVEYSKLHPNLKFILNKKNKGFAGANNQAVEIANGEFVVFLNNDTVVTPFWIEKLLNPFKADVKIGLVGPVTNSTGNEARILTDYSTPKDMEKFADLRSQKMSGVFFDIRMLAFYCVMAKKKVFVELGGLDEQFGVGMFEDDDMAVRYHLEGYRVICAEDVFIHHFQGASFGKLENESYTKIFNENRKKYEKKWSRVWEPYQLRTEVLKHLQGN